jgi:hypothetical protein
MTNIVSWSWTFIAAYVAGFILACVVTAFSMIRLSQWYLSNCWQDTPVCSTAEFLIFYWWLLFIPVVLTATFLIHRIYLKRQAKRG